MKSRLANVGRAVVSSIHYYVEGLYRHLSDEHAFFYAAGLAFNAITCLIPIMLILTSVLGIVLSSSELAVQKLDEILNTTFPPQPYAQDIKVAIRAMINDIIVYRSAVGFYGFIVLWWTASTMLNSIRTVLRRIFHITTSEPFLIEVAKNLLFIVVLGLLFLISNLLTWAMFLFESFVHDLMQFEHSRFDVAIQAVLLGFSYIPTFLMFFILYRYVPGEGITGRVALVSSFFATLLWWLAGIVFGWYLSTFHGFSAIYGTYAFIIVLLVWIYYSAVVFIVGNIMGELYRERAFAST